MNTNSSPRPPSNYMPLNISLKLLAAAALLLFLQFSAFTPTHAATTVVKVGQNSAGSAAQRFNAASITITAGDTVRWEWFNGAHDVQGYNYPGWSSGAKGGINSAGETYSFTFPTAGTYTYYCDEHAGPGDADPANIDQNLANKMVGKITVLPAGEPPPPGLSVQSGPVSFGSVVITGLNHDVDAAPVTWRASDATGSGNGWRVTISGGQFTAGTAVIPASNLRVRLLQTRITTISGNTAPLTQAGSYQPLSQTTPMNLLRAATGAGMGVYDFAPDFRLTVPASVRQGAYTADLVVTIVSGP